MRVLLLEDDDGKAERIVSVLNASGDGKDILVSVSRNVADARAKLTAERFDLLVLDIRVPFRDGEEPDDEGGIHLLRELVEDEQYFRPKYVVGITGVDEVFAQTNQIFTGHGWVLLRYSPSAPEWADSLRYFVQHVLSANAEITTAETCADVVVLVALDQPEFEGLKLVMPELHGPRPVGENILVWEGVVQNSKGRDIRVVVTTCWQMGLTASAIMSEKLLEKFRPKLFAMTGICAGFPDSSSLGDVVVATQSWEWQGGKIVVSEGERCFSPAPEAYRAGRAAITQLKALKADRSVIEHVAKRYFQMDIGKSWQIHFGPMVSGLSVVASKAQMEDVRAQHRKIVGLDMEAYSLYAAAYYSESRPEVVVMKGVCDFGSEEKADGHQQISATRSAVVLRALIETFNY